MSPRTLANRSRLRRSVMTFGLAALAATACRPTARVAAEPAVSGVVVRNWSQFDINVYALPKAGARPVWLGTVPAAGLRSLSVVAGALQNERNLVVRTQAVGSSRSWTSHSVAVNATDFAVLDLFADGTGDCSDSRLYTADVRESGPIMW